MAVYLGSEKVSVSGGVTNKSSIPIPPGYSKIAIDYLGLGNEIGSTVDGTTIRHSLGVIPNVVIIFSLIDNDNYFTDVISIKFANNGDFRTGGISFVD